MKDFDFKELVATIFGYAVLALICMGIWGCIFDKTPEPEYSPEPSYETAEDRISELEQENQDLKDRLDNINTMASDRGYDYSDLLDDIEFESQY